MKIIAVENLWKRYRVYRKPVHRILEWTTFNRIRTGKDVWALRDISFDAEEGSFIGIVGPNGAGKSTLLRILAGISGPDSGRVTISGRVSSLLELGAGFHDDFSGIENIRMNCSLMGMGRREADARIEEIVAYAELEDRVEQPLRTLSDGMRMRLAFSIATCRAPDIVLIDDTFAVGDARFRSKCFQRLREFRQERRTILLVSHDLGTIRDSCDRALWIDIGAMRMFGEPGAVVDQYLESAFHRASLGGGEPGERCPEPLSRWGNRDVEITGFSLEGASGVATTAFQTGDTMVITMSFRVNRPVKRAVFGCGFFRMEGTFLSGVNHLWSLDPQILPPLHVGDEGRVRCVIDHLPFLPGKYRISLYCYDHDSPVPTPLDHLEKVIPFEILPLKGTEHGIVDLPARWEITR